MKKLDMRFDEITFKNFIGQTFHEYRCAHLKQKAATVLRIVQDWI